MNDNDRKRLRATDDLHTTSNITFLTVRHPEGWDVADTSIEDDLAISYAHELMSRMRERKSLWCWPMRFCAMVYAFTMGLAVAVGYPDMSTLILLGVVVAIAMVFTEQKELR